MIIANIRVQATCALMVTKPEASAQKSQKLRPRISVGDDLGSRGEPVAADEGFSDCNFASRSASIAVTPMMMFIAAVIRIVVRTPRLVIEQSQPLTCQILRPRDC